MKTLLMSLLTLSALVSCHEGSESSVSSKSLKASTSKSISGLTRNELAATFVEQLNLDAEFKVDLVKDTTLDSSFIIIHNPLTDTYDAIDTLGFNPNLDSAEEFYLENSTASYSDLEVIPGSYITEYESEIIDYDEFGEAVYANIAVEKYVATTYQHAASGTIFKKSQASTADTVKMFALKEAAEIYQSAEFLSTQLGLSLSRGKQLAELKVNWEKASKNRVSSSKVDTFSTELLGFSLSSSVDALNQASSGDASSLDALAERSASVNEITSEHATKLITKVFGL